MADFLEWISNPLGVLARKGSGLSDTSQGLADAYGQIKAGQGDSLGSCAPKIVGGGTCELSSGKVAGEVGGRLAEKFARKAMAGAAIPGMIVVDGAREAFSLQSNHKSAIELLSSNKFPGLQHRELYIDGHRLEIHVDATGAGLSPHDPRVSTYMQLDEFSFLDSRDAQEFKAKNYKTFEALEQATVSDAIGSVHDYISANGSLAYEDRVKALMNGGQMAEMYRAREAASNAAPAGQEPSATKSLNL